MAVAGGYGVRPTCQPRGSLGKIAGRMTVRDAEGDTGICHPRREGVSRMPAIALFRGPSHVMEFRNARLLELTTMDGLGIPVREAYPEAWNEAIHVAMDDCFRAGRVIRLDRPRGVLILVPRRDPRGRVFGIGTYYVAALPDRLLRRQPRPPLHLPVGPTAEAG